ncbi:MAG: ComEC family competence protein, partial [Candidatus Nealsonbacteria bacterium]|nr:ComEC family competence protein [Candidatus Nealsonbacteria bacterium]
MTASRIFLYFCLSFIGGIFLSSFFTPPLFILGAGLIFGILLISVPPSLKLRASKRAGFVVLGFCVLFLVFGVWRHERAELKVINDELRKYHDLEQKITLIGTVSAEPDVREKSIKLSVKINEILLEDGPLTTDGRVLVTTQRYPEYQYGDKLKITERLKSPAEDINGFNYRDFLKKDGIYSVMSWPEIELLESDTPPPIWGRGFAKILQFKEKLRESIYQNLSPPQSSILGAIILGDKRGISQEWKEKLNITGVRHITAISGMHVAILAIILMTILIGLGFWRQQSFYFTIILISLFIIMTGLQPSAIRAGIMGGLFLLGQYLGRLSVSSRAVVFAAAIMLAQNPFLLKLDVGFQLSFLAIFGIIYFQSPIKGGLKFLPNPEIFPLRSLLAMTLSAQIFTLPILIYNFGYFSLIAPLTNILIVPLLPWLMIIGFIFTLSGIFWQTLGWIFSLPNWLLLTFIVKIVDWFSQIP